MSAITSVPRGQRRTRQKEAWLQASPADSSRVTPQHGRKNLATATQVDGVRGDRLATEVAFGQK